MITFLQGVIADLEKQKRSDDSLQVITFAEKPAVVRKTDVAFPIERHPGAGADHDVFNSHPDIVLREIDALLDQAAP